ncbi:hypothetical protein ACQ5SK_03155 [Bradyrhizobium japonicum]
MGNVGDIGDRMRNRALAPGKPTLARVREGVSAVGSGRLLPACTEFPASPGASHAGVVLSVIAIVFLPCLAWFGRVFADIITYPVLLGMVFLGVQRAAGLVRRMAPRMPVLAVVCGCGAGIGYFFVVNSRGYATVLTPEQAATGLQHLDTLYHASIANMLVNFGHLSTGLDGFMPMKYHVLSHIWMGCVGLWLGVTTLESYYLTAQIIAIPLLLFSLIMAGLLLRRSAEGLSDSALVTLIPLLLLMIADLWGWTSYLVSESYFISLFCSCLLYHCSRRSPTRGHRSDLP